MKEIIACGGEVSSTNFYFVEETFESPFSILDLEKEGYKPSGVICHACRKKPEGSCCVELDSAYVEIILMLKIAGLIKVDYQYLCCKCYDDGRRYNEYKNQSK